MEDAVRGTISKIAEDAASSWLVSLDIELDTLKKRHDCERTGEEINREIGAVAAKLTAAGKQKHFAKSFVLSQYVSLANQVCEAVEQRAVADSNALLAPLKLPALPSPQAPTVEDIPRPPEVHFPNKKPMQEWKLAIPWWPKTHDGGETAGHLEGLRKLWQVDVQDKANVWTKQFLNDHFDTYCEKRRAHFRAHLQRMLDDFEIQAKPKDEAAEAAEKLHRKMDAALRSLSAADPGAEMKLNNGHP